MLGLCFEHYFSMKKAWIARTELNFCRYSKFITFSTSTSNKTVILKTVLTFVTWVSHMLSRASLDCFDLGSYITAEHYLYSM